MLSSQIDPCACFHWCDLSSWYWSFSLVPSYSRFQLHSRPHQRSHWSDWSWTGQSSSARSCLSCLGRELSMRRFSSHWFLGHSRGRHSTFLRWQHLSSASHLCGSHSEGQPRLLELASNDDLFVSALTSFHDARNGLSKAYCCAQRFRRRSLRLVVPSFAKTRQSVCFHLTSGLFCLVIQMAMTSWFGCLATYLQGLGPSSGFSLSCWSLSWCL